MSSGMTWTLVGVLSIGVVAVGGYAMMDDSDEDNTNATTTEEVDVDTEENNAASNDFEANLELVRSALTGDQSVRCDFEMEGQSGVSYIKSGMFYTETRAEGQTFHMVANDENTHLWQSGSDQGFIFSANAMTYLDEQDEVQDDDLSQQVESQSPFTQTQENVNISCDTESVPDSQFALPDDVTFQTMEEMMGGAL